jgi:hypothetical protein
MISTNHDAVCLNNGSTWGFYFVTDAAKQWAESNLDCEEWQWLEGMLSVDHRCGEDITIGMREDGLTVVGRF